MRYLLIIFILISQYANAQLYGRMGLSIPVNPWSHGSEIGMGLKIRKVQNFQPFIEASIINRWDKPELNTWVHKYGLFLFKRVSVYYGSSIINFKDTGRAKPLQRTYGNSWGIEYNFFKEVSQSGSDRMAVSFQQVQGYNYIGLTYKLGYTKKKKKKNGTAIVS